MMKKATSQISFTHSLTVLVLRQAQPKCFL